MKYSDLLVEQMTQEIDLGRGRKARCRMLSPTENGALRRALPQPEAAVIRDAKGAPVPDANGGVLRDDGNGAYLVANARWYDRLCSATLAVAMGYTTSDGLEWDRSHLCDPAEGRRGPGAEPRALAFQDAESRRLAYIRAVAGDMLGDDARDGLLSGEELANAFRDYRAMGIGELVGRSAEGNSGSVSADQGAGAVTNG